MAAYLGAAVVIGVVRDRSQRLAGLAARRVADARADAVLRASEDRLRRTVGVAADGLLVFDAAGRLTLCNAASERLLDLPAARWPPTSRAGPESPWMTPAPAMPRCATSRNCGGLRQARRGN